MTTIPVNKFIVSSTIPATNSQSIDEMKQKI